MEKKKQNPPYLPIGVLEEFFKKIKIVNPPSVVDISTLRTWGVAKSHEYPLRSALGFLNIIDEKGKPTTEFKKIQIEGEQFKTNLKEIVEKAYSEVFNAYKIENVTSVDLINFFGQNYSPATKDRMVKCFVYLCRMAGIETPAFNDIQLKDQTTAKKAKTPRKPKLAEPRKTTLVTNSNEPEPIVGEWREYSHPMGKIRIRVDAPKEVVDEFMKFLKFVVLGDDKKDNK